jgi:hypothetical protein
MVPWTKPFPRPSLLLALILFLGLTIVPAGCAPVPAAAPVATAIPSPTPPPQMQDPATMATHEAQMHGTPTAAPQGGGGAQPAPGTALSAFTTADFAGAGVCVMCHEGLADAAGTDVSITTDWRSTMMANATHDPVWQAKVVSEAARNPDLAELIEAKCAACHVPMAAEQAKVHGAPVALLDDGFLDPANPLHAAAQDGVSCTLCHQIGTANLGEQAGFSGGYEIDASSEPPNREAFGPYPDPFGRPMQMHTGYLPVYGKHTGSAELCATCHNLYTPFVDGNGEVQGEFPEQTPYTEWEHSAFGTGGMVCQSCHMPVAGGGVVISTMPMMLGPREPFFRHEFVGGNAFMVEMLRDHGAELGVTADAVQFDATAARAAGQLGRAAALSVTEAARDGSTLTVRLLVRPATGHKFPTSFPSRRAWLHVTVTDGAGTVVFESGKPQPDGSIEGNDADAEPAAYEPHYDLVTDPDQVQIYEPIMGDTDGKVTYTLLRAAKYLKDNRLIPAGADKTALPPDIAVYGEAAEDANFAGGGDEVTYRVDLAGTRGPYTVEAELLYQPLSYRFVQDMLADGGAPAAQFGRYYTSADKTPDRVSAIAPVVVE